MCSRDERTSVAGTGEDDVAGFVSDEQRARYLGGHGREVNDADTVREMVDDPDLAIGSGCNRHRLHTDRNRVGMREPGRRDIEYLETIVGRIDGE